MTLHLKPLTRGRIAAFAAAILMAVIASAVVLRRAFAQGDPGTPPTDLLSLLLWLTTAGGASAVVSFIAAQIPAFKLPPEQGGLSSQAKWWLMLIASSALAVVAKLLIDFLPSDLISTLSPIATILIGVLLSFLANQTAYGIQRAAWKDRTRGMVFRDDS